MENKPYDVLKVEEYTTSNGEVKAKFHTVGVAFENTDSITVMLFPEIAVMGRLIIKARREKTAPTEDSLASNA